MMRARRHVLAGLLILTAAAVSALEPLPRTRPEAVGLSAAKLAAATGVLQEAVATQRLAGAVAGVARKGKLAYLEAVGVQDLTSRTPMAASSLFRIYSMTKPVTAVAVMMLHEQGRFRLEDPVAAYLPEFGQLKVGDGAAARPPVRPVTVADLLLHTSGLSHRTSELYRTAAVRSRRDSLPQFVTRITRAPLMEDPGTRFRYSEGTTVLGRLVEIWSGQPFDVFLQERIFAPLGMRDTMFWVDAERAPRLTTAYAVGQNGLSPYEHETVPFTERGALKEGAVGLVSTVPDFLRFSQMLLNGGTLDGVRVLQAATVARMVANGLPAPVLQARGNAVGWGLANVNVVIDPKGVDYPANPGEYGWDGSAGTIFWIDPRLELVTVLMWQSSPANPDALRQRFKTLVHAALTD